MIAVINNAVAGVGIALLARYFGRSAPTWVYVVTGIVGGLVLTWGFYAYQRWRFDDYEAWTSQRVKP